MVEQYINQWVQIQDNLKNHATQIKELRQSKNTIEEAIVSIMEKQSLASLELPNGTSMVLKTTSQLCPLNKEYIEDTLTGFFQSGSPLDASSCTNFIIDKRTSTEKTVLKLIKTRN